MKGLELFSNRFIVFKCTDKLASKLNLQGTGITIESNLQGTDITIKGNVQGTDIAIKRNVQGIDIKHVTTYYSLNQFSVHAYTGNVQGQILHTNHQ